MFKTEAHMHTSEGSICGWLTAVEMVRAYKEAGFSTVFVSNHFVKSIFDTWGLSDWDKIIDRFLLGYRLAKEEGDRIGINVLLSAELEFQSSLGHHYLVYGIDEAFLKRYPYLYNMSLSEFSEIARENGLLLVEAHPYRDNNRIVNPELVDAFEIINPNPRHDNHTDLAEETAKKYGLYRTAGCDAHRYEDIGRCATESEYEIKTVEDYISLIKSGKATLTSVE